MPVGARFRRSPRYLVDLPVFCKYTPQRTQAAMPGSGWAHILRDSGACLELTGAVPPGTTLGLLLQTVSDSLPLEAVVAWTGPVNRLGDRTLHGVFFPGLTADQRVSLRHLIRKEGLRWARAQRPPIVLSVRCQRQGTTDPPCQGWTGDVTHQGCLLFLPAPLPLNTVVEMTLATPHGDVPATAAVTWVASAEGGPTGRLVPHRVRFTDQHPLRDMTVGCVLQRLPRSFQGIAHSERHAMRKGVSCLVG